MKARIRGGGEGTHLCPWLVQKVAAGKTSHDLRWRVQVIMKYIQRKQKKIENSVRGLSVVLVGASPEKWHCCGNGHYSAHCHHCFFPIFVDQF